MGGGGKNKLPWSIIYGLKEEGGLGLVNLRWKDMSMKIPWVAVLQEDKVLMELADSLMGNNKGELLWRMSISPEEKGTKVEKKGIWGDIFEMWCKYSYDLPVGAYEVKQQVLWGNSGIRIGGKPLIYRNWIEKGCTTSEDFVNEQGEFLKMEEFQEKFELKGTVNELLYRGLIKAIPSQWKEWLKENLEDVRGKETKYKQISSGTQLTKKVYCELAMNSTLLWSKAEKLSKLLEEEADSEELLRLIRRITKYTICVKL